MSKEATNTAVEAMEEDEISLLDLAIALGEEKKTLFAIPAITTTLAIADDAHLYR
jgi:hypothetical protein